MNGRRVTLKGSPGSYIELSRTWKDGDRIETIFPMQFSLETIPHNPKRAALLYGPVVLAGECGTEGMQSPAPFSNSQLYNDYYTYDYRIPPLLRTTLTIDSQHPERSLKCMGSELNFITTSGDVLRPLYDIHRQRYIVYWDL